MTFNFGRSLAVSFVAVVALSTGAWSADSAATPRAVHVELKDGKGVSVGTADLSAAKDGVQVTLHLTHLDPGPHGIHFHEKADCTGPDFKSAGGHFNPEHKEHGLENPKGSHAGDMPNIELSRSGTLKTQFVAHGVTLGEGPDSLMRAEGAALVIHAKADDQKSNPAGNAGDRVACGVIPAQR